MSQKADFSVACDKKGVNKKSIIWLLRSAWWVCRNVS